MHHVSPRTLAPRARAGASHASRFRSMLTHTGAATPAVQPPSRPTTMQARGAGLRVRTRTCHYRSGIARGGRNKQQKTPAETNNRNLVIRPLTYHPGHIMQTLNTPNVVAVLAGKPKVRIRGGDTFVPLISTPSVPHERHTHTHTHTHIHAHTCCPPVTPRTADRSISGPRRRGRRRGRLQSV